MTYSQYPSGGDSPEWQAEGARQEMQESRLLSLKISAMAIIALTLWIGCAFAHDHDHPELAPWFEKLQSKGGAPCCDGKDGTSLDDPDWSMAADGKHFRVRLDGEWYDVPDNAVVLDKNPVGHAIVWTYITRMGDKVGYGIRCFMPGTMT